MFNHCGSNHHAFRSPDAVPCPTPGPISVPFPSRAGEDGAFAVQDGSTFQTIALVDVAGLILLGGTNRAPIAFDRFLPPLPTTIPVTAATPVPPGFAGSITLPANPFTGVGVTTSGLFDITAGLSLIGAVAGILGGGLIAQIVRFPGGIGTNTPQPIATIPLAATATIPGVVALPLLRGTIRVPDVPLNAGDVVQIQLIQSTGLVAASVVAVTYAFLEIE